MSGASAPRWRSDAAGVFALALAARLAVVAWAAGRFPPTADGEYYHRLAARLAQGSGYTWAWPDGAVTYAAHYPVGYPGAVAVIYAIAGPHPAAAMALNALVGALAALAVHRLAARAASRRTAALAGALVALHPGLVAYTPALMTEGVTGALLACAAWAAAWAGERAAASRSALPFAAVGVVLGIAALVRPQSVLLAPALAWIAAPAAPAASAHGRRWSRALPAILATVAALAVCAPWTARNCARMGRCALVSVNGGWNLLIGAEPAGNGSWAPLEVPDACREVFDEAGKDACFEREARRRIAERPAAWLALAPRKLAATFDYCGAAGWYLHASNPTAFGEQRKIALGKAETVYEMLVLLLALAWAARAPGARGGALVFIRIALLVAGVMIAALYMHAWVAYVALLGLGLLQGRALLRGPLLASSALVVLTATALTHAAFFGAGRYALVCFPLLSGLAALAFARGGTAARGARPEAGSAPASPGIGGDFDRPPRSAAF